MKSPSDLSPNPPPVLDRPPTLAEVHKEYAAYVQNLLKPRTPSRDLDDLVQLSFIEINQGLPRYDVARPLQPWIATIVLRTFGRYVRRNLLRFQSEQLFGSNTAEVDPGSEDRVEARDLLPHLFACLKKRELEMVLRRLRDEEPIEVISRDLGISADGGYKLLQTAIAKLKEAKRRQEMIEQRTLSTRRALMLPFWFSFRVEMWIDRARAWLGRPLERAKAAFGSAGLVVALGVLLLPPLYPNPGAPAREAAPPAAAAVEEASAVKASAVFAMKEANPAPAPERAVAPLGSPSAKRAARPASAALPGHQAADELISMSHIQALVRTNPAAARAAIGLHKKMFAASERFKTELGELELLTQAELAK